MQSLRSAIADAADRKRVPAFQPGSTRDLGIKLGLSVPISAKNLITGLENLPPAGVTYDSGPLTANYVHGSATVYLQSDGLVDFTGQVHEAGVFGDNYLFA